MVTYGAQYVCPLGMGRNGSYFVIENFGRTQNIMFIKTLFLNLLCRPLAPLAINSPDWWALPAFKDIKKYHIIIFHIFKNKLSLKLFNLLDLLASALFWTQSTTAP